VTDQQLAALLKALRGKAFCRACLTIMMGKPIDPIRVLTKRLNVWDGFTMKIAACSGCDQRRALFGYSPAA
jgi:hypothetical protein